MNTVTPDARWPLRQLKVTIPVSPVPHPPLLAAVDEGAVRGLVGAGGGERQVKRE